MSLLDSDRGRASLLVMLLGAAILVALLPFATGLIAIPVLYVILQPVHAWLSQRLGPRFAAAVVTILALILIVVPAVIFGALILGEVRDLASEATEGNRLQRIRSLRIGGYAVGPAIADASRAAIAWLGSSALGLIGTATRQALNLVIALFGLYHLLLRPKEVWASFSASLPYSKKTTERLRTRFRNVTTSTIIGTGLVAVIQGTLLGTAFWMIGIPDALFWSLVTIVLSILPVVGSGLVWAPAALWLFSQNRPVAGVMLALLGLLIIGNMDFFVRPLVSKRWAHIHPVITLVGALAGVRFFGLLGLLIGPLALSYFFELMDAYSQEYAAEPAE